MPLLRMQVMQQDVRSFVLAGMALPFVDPLVATLLLFTRGGEATPRAPLYPIIDRTPPKGFVCVGWGEVPAPLQVRLVQIYWGFLPFHSAVQWMRKG